MKKHFKIHTLIITLLFLMIAFSSCSNKNTAEQRLDKNYNLENVSLGLSYVPDSNYEYRQNTLGHLEVLDIDKVRIGQHWDLREPKQGEFEMQPMIDRLDFYAENDIEVLMTIEIKSIPIWAKEMDEETFLNSFELFIEKMLYEYGEKISIIQFGNEWDWEIDKHLASDTDVFIKMNNILYDEVSKMDAASRPIVSLGSISIGGLHSLAFLTGDIDNIYFDGKPMYTEQEIDDYSNKIASTQEMAEKIFAECQYDIIDIHLYDDYWNWETYKGVVEDAVKQNGGLGDVVFMASEFGGPEPDMEPQTDEYRANQLYHYIKTIDEIGIDTAYYFKLHEHQSDETVYHPYSYLITKGGKTTKTYDELKNFGENN